MIKSHFEFSPQFFWLVDWLATLASMPSISALLHRRFFAHDKVSMRPWGEKKNQRGKGSRLIISATPSLQTFPQARHKSSCGQKKRAYCRANNDRWPARQRLLVKYDRSSLQTNRGVQWGERNPSRVIKLRYSFENCCELDHVILSRPTLSSKIILGICLTRMEKWLRGLI